MRGVVVAGGAAIALVASAFSAQGAPLPSDAPPGEMRVNLRTVNGSGCPAGTVGVEAAPDRSSFTVNYSQYLARAGAGAEATDARQNCQLVLDVDAPEGYTYAVFGLDHSGYAHLAAGARGLQRSAYYFQGSPSTEEVTHELTGPYDGPWHTSDSDAFEELVWAPCGEDRHLNVNTELRVDAGDADPRQSVSFLAMRATDVPATTYHLTWKQC
jgi:hypothetical protein